MSELAERAREIRKKVIGFLVQDETQEEEDWLQEEIEQALLAERRLAMEEARLLMCSLCRRNEEFDGQFHRLKDAMTPKNEPYRRVQCASLKLRAAAEKEVQR